MEQQSSTLGAGLPQQCKSPSYPALPPTSTFPLPHTPALPAVVTCGGLCPGLNDVVQGLVSKLSDYGVPDGNVVGIK